MGIKCPKCHSDNPDDSIYCAKCASPLKPSKDIPVTETLETPKEELTTGTTFAGRYQIIEELGKGGMGAVYRAMDTELKEEVALKLIKSEIAADKKTIERFKNELKLARKIRHRNVGGMYELMEAEGKPFITMEYVEGKDLKSLMRKRVKLTEEEAISIAKQVCEGLAEAHELGVIHRDLKPQNIMIDERGNAKIMDFGIARSVSAPGVTQTGVIIGTPDYISPEQAEGEEADQRSDIYSLGVILYEMVIGSVPFKGDTALSVALKHKAQLPKDPRKLNPEVSDDLSRLILICMEKDRERRYQTAEALFSDLRNIEEGFPLGKKIRPRRETFVAALIRKKLFIPASVVALAIIAAGIYVFTGRARSIDSVAVLPLENLSGDPDQEYFVEGMHEALITELSKIKALKVISRPSVMRYKNSDKSLPEIAKELNVRGIIAGSALQEEERVRITVQLIEADTERNLWADKYDRDYRDILMLHSEVALDIAQEIRIAVTPEEQTRLTSVRPIDPEAYQLYLKGNFQLTRLSEEAFRKAVEHFQQAIKKEPSFAQAHAGLASAYLLLGSWHMSVPDKMMYSKVEETCLKALELDDTLAEAYLTLGSSKYYEWDWAGAEKMFKRGIELNQSSTVERLYYANFLTAMGRFDESIEIGKETLEIDPLSPAAYNELGFAMQFVGQYNEAFEQYKKGLELDPDFPQSHWVMAHIYSEMGLHDKAVVHCKKLMSLTPDLESTMALVGYYYGVAGRRTEALKILNELEKRAKHKNISAYIAIVYLGLGDKEQAIECLEKAYDEHDIHLVWLKVAQRYDPLRDDQRFQDLMQRMNFPK